MKTIYTCFPGGKFKALTMSYDDGVEADRRLVGIFDEHGIKGTFHVNGGLFEKPGRLEPDEVKSLYAGHEVAVHTFTHPTISRCPEPMVAAQVLEDRRALESIVGYPVRGMSYPNGSHSPGIRAMLPSLGIAYSRITGNSDSFELPEDPYAWKATCHHKHRLMEHAAEFLAFSKSQYLKLMYVWGHSYEFDNDGNWSLMEEFCEKASGNPDTWYATNIQIMDALADSKRLRFTADGDTVENPNARESWLSVDGKIVRVAPGETLRL